VIGEYFFSFFPLQQNADIFDAILSTKKLIILNVTSGILCIPLFFHRNPANPEEVEKNKV